MHQSVYEADCSDLIAHGWGSHPRCFIPADWMTRRGPDSVWGRQKPGHGYRAPRRSYAELRTIRLGQQWPPVHGAGQ